MFEAYKKRMSYSGSSQSDALKHQSAKTMDVTFNNDYTHKDALLKNNNGEWCHEDIKWQVKTSQSELKDIVAYYVQFRPGVVHSVGEYIIIPDENSELPDVNNKTHWWLIVGRDNPVQFTRYLVIQCNWDFKWVSDGNIYTCFAALRNANSYNSGIWTDEYSTSVDDLCVGWLPFNEETQTIHYDVRFMLSMNKLYPKIYKVTKINELTPQGVIKITFKQDFYDRNVDDPELGVCNIRNINTNNIDIKNTTYKAEISLSQGTTNVLKYRIGKKHLKVTAFDSDGNSIPSKEFLWKVKAKKNDVIFNEDYFNITTVDENHCVIQTNTDDVNIIGSNVVVTAIDITGKYTCNYYLEVSSS